MKTISFDPAYLADAIRLAREAKFITQAEVAKRTGLKEAAVSHFECGHRTPSIPNLIRLCEALNATPSHLLSDYCKP